MDYGYESYDSTFAGLLSGFTVIFVILGIIILAWAIVSFIALWKVYKKAGKKGWESIVPFYGYWVLVEIAGLNWWWFLLAIVKSIVTLFDLEDLSAIANLVSLFATFNIYYNIAKKFNKSNGTAVCAGIFYGIFVLIFGFSKDAVYDINIPVSKNGVFGTPEMSNNTYSNQGNVQVQPTYSNMNNVTEPMMNAVNQQQNVQSNISNNESQVEQPVDNSNVGEVPTQKFSFCGNCGTKLNMDVRFCPNCGRENN